MAGKKYPFYEAMMKGILGPSIGDANENAATIGDNGQKVGDLSGGSVSHRFAAANGVMVSNGKFKCPPGSAGAGDFTDALGSTCGTPSQQVSEKAESKPNRFREGSFVRWDSSGGKAQGQIEHVMTDGTLGIPGSRFTIKAKPDDPAVLVRIWKKNVDGWAATETLVGHKASTLSLIEALKNDNGISEKVGLIGSHSKPLQAIGAGASMAIPGDSADVRSPVRSTIAEIVTPGGTDHHMPGRRPKIGGGQDHCPPGFEFGGRFTNARLSTCGTRLFDLPAFQGTGQAALAQGNLNDAENPLTGTLIAASKPGKITSIQRRAEIAVVGDLNVNQMEAAVANNIPIVSTSEKNPTRLIRRDGSVLQATVPVARLAKTRNNADIKDGVIITRVANGANLGQNEVSLLGAGARSAIMVFPDGSSLRLSRADNASSESIRGLGRKWAAVQKSTPVDEYGAALEKLVDASNGKLTLTPDIKNVKGPIQMIRVQREDGSQRMVRRWIYEIFLASSAPARPKDSQAWTVVPSSKSLRTYEPTPPVKKKFLNSL